MTRRLIFQIHSWLGVSIGFVLAVMGLTGATLAFQDEIMAALSPKIEHVAASTAPRLSLDELITRASAQRNSLRVAVVMIKPDPTLTPRLFFDAAKNQNGFGESSFIDPYTGRLLGTPRGQAFFSGVERLHRFLALPGGEKGIGRLITGVAALSLIFFAGSGLYLRWPRRPLDWRSWFSLDLKRPGRPLYRSLHATLGAWVLLCYLLSALTGLFWAFDWYQTSALRLLTGRTSAEILVSNTPPGPRRWLGPSWASFDQRMAGRYAKLTIVIPKDDTPMRYRVEPAGAFSDLVVNEMRFDQKSGRLVNIDRFAARPLGLIIVGNMFYIHRGGALGTAGRVLIFLSSLTLPLFPVTGLLLYLSRRPKRARPATAAAE